MSLKIFVVHMTLSEINGTRIRTSFVPSLKFTSMGIICMTQQNQPGIMHTIVLSNPGIVLLVGRLGFILDFVKNKLRSKAFLTSAFDKRLFFYPEVMCLR